jgi:RNA polymerase sigma-70 factor (ECF subfamily)
VERMNETDDFDAFYHGSFRRLLRYASGLAVDLGDAEDLVRKAYADAWLRWRSLRDHEEPEVWLRSLVTRLAMDRRRRPVSSPALGTEALGAFPLDQRRVLALRFLLDRTSEQISEETATDLSIVESWLARGREAGLAQLLPAMGSQADQVDRLPPTFIREAGAKRLRSQRAGVTWLVVLAVIAISGGIAFLVNRTEPTTSLPPPKHGAVVPLHQVGPGVAYGPGGLAGQPLTVIGQGRAFATWQQSDSTPVIVAIDLQSGEQVWRHHEEPVGACRTLSGSDEVLLCRYQKAGSAAQQVIAFDSAGGDVLWRFPLSRHLMRFGDVVVIDGDQDLIGLNLRTGEKIWTVAAGPIEDTQITPMMSSSASGWATEPAEGWADHRLAIMNVNGRLRFVNTDSGAVTFESTVTTAGRLDSLAAVDGTAFAGDGAKLHSVSASGQTVVHTVPAGRTLIRATPCGAGHLCVAEQGPQRYDLVIVDVAKKQPLWRVNTTAVPFGNANSGFYFITAGSQVQVFDHAGTPVESFSTDTEIPAFIGPDLVLRFHGNLVSTQPVGIALTVGNISATSTVPIGQLVAFARGCSPNTTTVVCPTDAGVTVWRYID